MSLLTTFTVLFLWLQTSTPIIVEKSFCEALYENDKASLKIILDKKLDTLDIKGSSKRHFELIKAEIAKYDCVSAVEIVPGMLRSDPPIKIFEVKINLPGKASKTLEIGIQVFPDKLRFNYY
ncbi:hypothetical protein ACT29I_08380 [Saccharicrinis sp. GN24d3]